VSSLIESLSSQFSFTPSCIQFHNFSRRTEELREENWSLWNLHNYLRSNQFLLHVYDISWRTARQRFAAEAVNTLSIDIFNVLTRCTEYANTANPIYNRNYDIDLMRNVLVQRAGRSGDNVCCFYCDETNGLQVHHIVPHKRVNFTIAAKQRLQDMFPISYDDNQDEFNMLPRGPTLLFNLVCVCPNHHPHSNHAVVPDLDSEEEVVLEESDNQNGILLTVDVCYRYLRDNLRVDFNT
jgi:hypothetical protein